MLSSSKHGGRKKQFSVEASVLHGTFSCKQQHDRGALDNGAQSTRVLVSPLRFREEDEVRVGGVREGGVEEMLLRSHHREHAPRRLQCTRSRPGGGGRYERRREG